MIIGAVVALAILAVAAAVYYTRCRDQRTAPSVKEIELRSVAVAGAGHEATTARPASRARVAPDALPAAPVGSRQQNWTDTDGLQDGPRVCTASVNLQHCRIACTDHRLLFSSTQAQHEFATQHPRLAATSSGSEVWKVRCEL